MLRQPTSAIRRASRLGSCLTQVSALYMLLTGILTLLVLTGPVQAAQLTLAWDDPNNDPATVSGYHLYYWPGTTLTPPATASVRDVGKQTTYTLTDLAAGTTYNFAVTAYNSTTETADSNVVSQTFAADAPVASFSATPSTGPAPLTVTFTSTSTGTITSWAWTFGDGGTSTASNPLHTYTAVNTYTVQLIVAGPSGQDTATATVTVSNLLPPPPVANFTATPSTGSAPLLVTFTDASTGSITAWAWTFGDGTSSTAQNPQHTYSTAGTYPVSLTVTGSGGSATKTASISVTVPPPVANFSATPTTGTAPLSVQFTNASTGSISTWTWSFGDGGSSSAQNPQHTYSTAGTYPVSLTVTGPGGSNTATKVNYITAQTNTTTVQTNPTGPRAAYGFSEGTGPTTADASGNAYVGSLLNGVAWAPGKYGTGLSFNGTSSYVALPASLDLPTLPFTLEAWVKPTDYTFWRTIFSKRASYAATAMRLDWLLDKDTGRARLTQPASDLIFPYAPPLNTWTHLTVVAQSSGTQLYVNGVLTQTLGAFTLGSSATAPVSLGASQNGADAWFNGGLDEVRLYTRALSACEIQADMQAPVDATGPVAAYGFSEGTGPTTADASGHAYVGSLLNSVAWVSGKYGTGLSFDGVNDYVVLPSSLDIPTLPFTLEAWVRPTDYTYYRTIFSKRASYAAMAMRLDWLLNKGTGRVRLDQAASHLTFSYAPPLNTWTHLAVVAQSSGTQLYVNGVLTQTRGVFTLGSSATAPVSLGAAQQGTDNWFNGVLDDVRIYSRALCTPAIQADMATPVQ